MNTKLWGYTVLNASMACTVVFNLFRFIHTECYNARYKHTINVGSVMGQYYVQF